MVCKGILIMFWICDYTQEEDRNRIYREALLLSMRHWRTIGPGGMDAIIGLKNAYRVDERFNPQDATHIESLSPLLQQRAYNY